MAGWDKRQNPYYPNQRYQYGRDYNFSSDVNLSNAGGSFQFGAPPPQGYGRPYGRGGGRRGGGGGFRGGGGGGGGGGYMGGRGGGWGGGYNPQPYGYNQRGYGNQQYYRDNYARRGPPGGGMGYRGNYRGGGQGYGGNYNQGYHQGQFHNKKFYGGGGDPFYSHTMFEDPWRFLLPTLPTPPVKKHEDAEPKVVEATSDVATKTTNDGDGAEAMEVAAGSEENRTDPANEVEAMEGETDAGGDGSRENSAINQKGESVSEGNGPSAAGGMEGEGVSATGENGDSAEVAGGDEKRVKDASERLEGEGEVTVEQNVGAGKDNPVVEGESEDVCLAKEEEVEVPVVGENECLAKEEEVEVPVVGENESGAATDE